MPGRRWAIAVVLLAVAVRVAAVLALQSDEVPRSTYEHGEIAANLLDGRGFSTWFLGAEGPTSQQAPAYPVLVAAAFAVGGVEEPRSLLLLQIGQAAMGGLMALAVMAMARSISPGRPAVAILAGLVAALHPTLVYAATHVQVACLAALLVAVAFVAADRAGRSGRLLDAAAVGAAIAAIMLTDPILALIGPSLVWIIARGQGLRAAIRPILVVVAVAALCVSPWILRNYRVHGEPVFIKSSFGYAFWQGNCSISEGTDKVVRPSVDRILADAPGGLREYNLALWRARHEAGYIDDIALTEADYRLLGSLSEPERSRVLFRRALDDLRADPSRYPLLCLRRLTAFVFFDETNPKTRSLTYRAGHLGLTIAAAIGWLAMGPVARRRLAPSALAALLIAAFHALTITSARFHIPIEPLMAVWASGIAMATSRSPAGGGLGHVEWLGPHRVVGKLGLARASRGRAAGAKEGVG